MKFEIPFDEAIYLEQSDLQFSYTWKKFLKKKKEHLTVGIIVTLIGILIMIGKSNIGIILAGAGIFSLILCYRLDHHYKINRKKYYDLVNANLKLNLNDSKDCLWELDENTIHFKNSMTDITLKWEVLSGYRKIGDTIFLDSNIGLCFMMSKKELGDEKFAEMIKYLDGKIKQTSL
jgi:hypothetical protein